MKSATLSLTVFILSCVDISLPAGLEGIKMCDIDNKCPEGSSCQYSSSLPGLQVCQVDFGGNFKAESSDKRSGRCPQVALKTNGSAGRVARQARPFGFGWGCNTHQDCPSGLRCCPTSAGYSVCSETEKQSDDPQIVVLIEGNSSLISNDPQVFDFVGSVTLVSSKGFNVVVDTGNVRKKVVLVEALKKAGFSPEDINFVVTTHGHPDHYSNSDLFSNVANNFGTYVVSGSKFANNPLAQQRRYLINDDPNLEILATPGHTPQCTSLIVRNVPNRGTVAVVGDLFLNKDDYRQTQALQQSSYSYETYDRSRRQVACMSDWIVPGHGPTFQVDATLKGAFNCTS